MFQCQNSKIEQLNVDQSFLFYLVLDFLISFGVCVGVGGFVNGVGSALFMMCCC